MEGVNSTMMYYKNFSRYHMYPQYNNKKERSDVHVVFVLCAHVIMCVETEGFPVGSYRRW
jgi:hypothetical protein